MVRGPLHELDWHAHESRRHHGAINGKHLTAIHFDPGGFSGNQVVFGAEFSDDLI